MALPRSNRLLLRAPECRIQLRGPLVIDSRLIGQIPEGHLLFEEAIPRHRGFVKTCAPGSWLARTSTLPRCGVDFNLIGGARRPC